MPSAALDTEKLHTLKKFARPLPQGVCQILDNASLFPTSQLPPSLLPIHLPSTQLPYLPSSHRHLRCFDLFNVFERVHACLWRGQGDPWAPGAPSRGSPGRVLAQTTSLSACHAPLVIASKLVLILISLFDRLGVGLCSVWRSCWGRLGTFVGPSWSQNRLQTVLTSKNIIVAKYDCFNSFGCPFAQDGAPKRHKIVPRRAEDRLGFFCFILIYRLDCFIVWGSVWVWFEGPKWRGGPKLGAGHRWRNCLLGRLEAVLFSSCCLESIC